MADLFIRLRDIAGCPWTIWEFGNIWENAATGYCVLQLWLILHQHSTKLIMLKYLTTWVSFNVVVFVPLFSSENHLQKVARLWKHAWGRFFFDNLKKSLVEVCFHFYQQLCKNILEWLLSYEITSCNL